MRRGILAWLVAGIVVLGVGAVLAAPPAGPPGAGGGPAMSGPRLMRGEVTKVNEAKGTLVVKTAEGDLELQLPPGAVKGIRKGDRLTVRLVVQPAAASGGPRRPAPNGAGPKSP
jgi:hypothetical protein